MTIVAFCDDGTGICIVVIGAIWTVGAVVLLTLGVSRATVVFDGLVFVFV